MKTTAHREPTIKLRPSAMDRARICPASHYPEPDEPLINIVGDDAGPIGSCSHEIQNKIVKHEEYNYREICAKWRVKPEDVDFLKYMAYKFVEILEAQFDVEKWESEVHFHFPESFVEDGTCDIIGITRDGKTIIIFDYKSGRASSDHRNQLRSYAHLALKKAPDTVENVIALIGWARDEDIQKWEWTRESMAAWEKETKDIIYGWDGRSYTVGEHCTFCPRFSSCEARAREMKSAHELMNLPSTAVLSPSQFKAAWGASASIIRKMEGWRDRVKEYIQTVAPIPMGDGRMLDVVEKNSKADIDPVLASIVLQDQWDFTYTDVLECCSISKKDVEDKAVAEAAHGMKGKARREVVEDLKKQGALTSKSTLALKIVDIPKGGE